MVALTVSDLTGFSLLSLRLVNYHVNFSNRWIRTKYILFIFNVLNSNNCSQNSEWRFPHNASSGLQVFLVTFTLVHSNIFILNCSILSQTSILIQKSLNIPVSLPDVKTPGQTVLRQKCKILWQLMTIKQFYSKLVRLDFEFNFTSVSM